MLTLDICLELVKVIKSFEDKLSLLEYLLSYFKHDRSIVNVILKDKDIYKEEGQLLNIDILRIAIEKAHHNILQCFHENGNYPLPEDITYRLITYYGSLDTFIFVKNVLSITPEDNLIVTAARNQHWDIVKNLLGTVSLSKIKMCLEFIIKYNKSELLLLLDDSSLPNINTDIVRWSIFHGRLDYLEKYHSSENCNKYVCDGHIFFAILRNHFNILKWYIINHGIDNANKLMMHAALHGRLDMLEFLYSCNNQKIDALVLDNAISSGHIDIIRWITNNTHLKLNYNNIMLAAVYGHLNFIKCILYRLPPRIIYTMIDISGIHGHRKNEKFLSDHMDGINRPVIYSKKRKDTNINKLYPLSKNRKFI